MKKTPQQHIIWITKHVSGFCATNNMMFRRGHENHTKCPCCKLQDVRKTARNQARCTDPDRVILWKDSVDELKTLLLKKDTEPNLQYLIILYLINKGEKSLRELQDIPNSFNQLIDD